MTSDGDGEAGADGHLPPSIGRPATRALTEVGLTSLDAVASRSAKELLALHGVGPKAIRILRDELAARGVSWD